MASVEAFEGFEAFEGRFRATRKKDLARQSPEPTACATPPTVSQRPEPTVWQVRGFGASEASRIQKLAAPTASMAEPLARFEGFEGFQGLWHNQWQVSKRLRGLTGLRGLRRLKGSFGPLEKKDLARQSPEPTACATPPTVSQSPEPTVWQGFGASEASMERLKRPESRRMEQPWQVSKRLRGLRGLRRLKGSFGPLEKKDLARQSPEPTACATPPTVSQSPEPTVWQVRGFGASEASRIQKLAAPTASMAEPLARFEGFEGFQGFEGFEAFETVSGH